MDTTPELNIANPKHPDYGKISNVRFPEPGLNGKQHEKFPFPGQGDYGTSIFSGNNVIGALAVEQVQPNLVLADSYILYAPNLESANGDPLEVVPTYWKFTGQAMGRVWRIYDHSISPPNNPWVVSKTIDSTFLSTYTTTWGGTSDTVFYTATFQCSAPWCGGNVYSVVLYNFNTNLWEVQYTQSNSWSRTDGWNQWESFFNGSCPSGLPKIESRQLEVAIPQWTLVTGSYGGLHDTTSCSNYNNVMVSPYYDWYLSS